MVLGSKVKTQIGKTGYGPPARQSLLYPSVFWLLQRFASPRPGVQYLYNTHILNPYLPKLERERLQAEYEKRYKSLTGARQPRVIAVDLNADIVPHEYERVSMVY